MGLREAERRLQEAEHRAQEAERERAEMRAVVEDMAEGFFALDEHWCFRYVNHEAARLLKRTGGELVGKNLWSEFPETVDPTLYRECHRAVAERVPVEFEAFVSRLSTWLAVRARPVERGLWVYCRAVTDGALSEESLRRSEQHARSLIETAAVMVTVLGAGGTVKYESAAIERILGYTPAERVGGSAFELIHPDDAPVVIWNFTQLVRRPEGAPPVEYRVRHKDGSWRILEATAKNLLDDQAVGGIVVTASDITERKRAEEARAWLSAILDSTTDFVGITDPHGRVLYLNSAARAMTGLREGESVTSLNIPDVHPDWATELIVREGLPAALRDGAWSGETAIAGRGGAEIPVSQVIIAHKTPGGAVQYFSTTARDISERKRGEEALRHSEQHFRSLIENTSDIITILRADGITHYASASAHRVLGYSPDDLVGKNAFDFVHPADLARVTKIFAGVLEHPATPVTIEYRCRHANGSWRSIAAVAKNLLDHPAVNGIVINSRDVTERQQLEEQLLQAQKMEAIGKLAGGIAHDFNNMLTAIQGYSELLLLDLEPSDPKRGDIQEIRKAADRAASLTRQLLAFSRKQLLQPRVLDLGAVVADMEKMLRRLIGEDIELITAVDPGLGSVRADPGQIEQVLVNLVVNARDAMPEGGTLKLELSNAECDTHQEHGRGSGRCVVLAITDTGTGMDEPTQERIFEPFFTTKEVGKGTGLGLSTVYGIVKQSGGDIQVASSPGRGTTFRIFLPRAGEAGLTEPGAPAAKPDAGSETVLLVEDEDVVRTLAGKVLRGSGYAVLDARSGPEAIRIAEQHQGVIHLVLTDVVMPGMSGVKLAERLAAQRPGLQVLYMTGYTDDAVVHHGVPERGTRLIQKPFSAEALALTVREVLDACGR